MISYLPLSHIAAQMMVGSVVVVVVVVVVVDQLTLPPGRPHSTAHWAHCALCQTRCPEGDAPGDPQGQLTVT